MTSGQSGTVLGQLIVPLGEGTLAVASLCPDSFLLCPHLGQKATPDGRVVVSRQVPEGRP